MSQHDYIIANADGATVRADINSVLAAIVSQNSGATAPTTTFAYMWWFDTTTAILKQRNATDSGWIPLWKLSTSGWQVLLTKGADIASAATLTPGSDGNYFDVTGTAAVTAIASIGIGTVIKLHFDGILTLTHDAADLVLPGGANITTAVGDEAEFVEYASGDWRCTKYTRAAGYVEAMDQSVATGADVTFNSVSGDGSGLTGIGAADQEARDHNTAQDWKILDLEGQTAHGLINTVSDTFSANTYVDEATSTGETHDSTDKLYLNALKTASTIGGWTGATGSWTATGDDLDNTANDKAMYVTAAFTGDFDFGWTSGTDTHSAVGIFKASDIGSWSDVSGANSFNSWWHYGHANAAGVATYSTFGNPPSGTSVTVSSGDLMVWSRRGSTITLSKNGTIMFTSGTTYSGDVHAFLQEGGNVTPDINDVYWTDHTSGAALTLYSEAFTADAAPGSLRGLFDVEFDASAVLNTDLIGKVTADGATWETLVLAKVSTTSATRAIYAATVTSGFGTGTTPKLRFEATGTYIAKLHGWGLQADKILSL